MTVRIPDTNGWYEIRSNPLTVAGVYEYLGSSIKAADPNKKYKVLRAPDELSTPETLNSFRLLPCIDDHTMLGTEPTDGNVYMPAEQKGVHGYTGDLVYFNLDDDTVYGNIKLISTSLGRKIDGGKRQISMGYKCKYDWTPGIYKGQAYDCKQTLIRGNHWAIVHDGRMGDSVAVMDDRDVLAADECQNEFVITFDERDIMADVIAARVRAPKAFAAAVKKIVAAYGVKVKDKLKAGTTIATMDADDDTALASDMPLSDIADMLGDVMPMIADINDSMTTGNGDDGSDDMEAVMDATGNPVMDDKGKPKMQKKVKPAVVATTDSVDKPATATEIIAAMDAAVTKAVKPLQDEIAALKVSGGPKAMVVEIAKRDELANKLSPFVGVFDHKEMTLTDVAKYGADKLKLPVEAGQEISSVQAYLHGRTPPRPTHGVAVAVMDSSGATPRKSSVAAHLEEANKIA